MKDATMTSVRALFVVAITASCANTVSDNGGSEEEEGGGAPQQTFSRTFTTAQDYANGASDGVNTDTDGNLQMNAELRTFETPFIWLPNSSWVPGASPVGDPSVSQVDTKTVIEKGRYSLVHSPNASDDLTCYNPSRTTVDIDGNVWVGCRGYSSYIDRSSVGVNHVLAGGTCSPGADHDVPCNVDHKVFKVAKGDATHPQGTILLRVNVGYAPRALALDADNHLWVGSSVDDSVWEIDGETGHCLIGDAIDPVTHQPTGCDRTPAIRYSNAPGDDCDFPYGDAVDQRGHLWVVCRKNPSGRPSQIAEIDTATGQKIGIYPPNPPYDPGLTNIYGIAIDQMNNVWVGTHGGDYVFKVKGVSGIYSGDGQYYAAGELIGKYQSGGHGTTGVAVDLDGNVWVANYGSSTASKLNGVTGAIMDTVNVQANPIGAGVDAYGNAWIVSIGGNAVQRINGLDAADKKTADLGHGPYTYSDMLGLALKTITRKGAHATWRVKVDSGVDNPTWESIKWNVELPNGTSLQVRSRCAATEQALATTSGWSAFMSSSGPMSCGTGSGRWAEVEAQFSTTSGASPVLSNLSLSWH